MLFTDGKLQAFEQMMKQSPRRPLPAYDKQQKTKPALTPSPSSRKESPHGRP